LLKQHLQQQQQQVLQPVQQLQQPVLLRSPTVIAVGEMKNPRPVSSGSVIIVPDTVQTNTPTEHYRIMSAQNEPAVNVLRSKSEFNTSNHTKLQSSGEGLAVKRSSEYRTMNSDLTLDITFFSEKSPVEVASRTETPQVVHADNRSTRNVARAIPSPYPYASTVTHGQPVTDNKSVATVTKVMPPPPPPAPPLPPAPPAPLPPAQQKRDAAALAAVNNDVGVPYVRVGKIQWPPPRDDEERPAVQVGRFKIEEKKSDPSVENVGLRPAAMGRRESLTGYNQPQQVRTCQISLSR